MENMINFYGFWFKKSASFFFFRKLFVYGSGTYTKGFNEQQRVWKTKQWLKCVFKTIYNRWIQCKIIKPQALEQPRQSVLDHLLWCKVTKCLSLMPNKTKPRPALYILHVQLNCWRHELVTPLHFCSFLPGSWFLSQRVCSFQHTQSVSSRNRW